MRRGRDKRVAERTTKKKIQAPFIKRKIDPIHLLEEESLQRLEQHTDRILSEVGIEITDHPETLELFKKAGAKVEGSRLYCEGSMCREIIKASAPETFIQHARNRDRSVQIGGNASVFVPAYGPPFVRDIAGGRRYATMEDFRNFVKLAYMSDSMNHSGGVVCEPVDLPVSVRHLDMIYAHMHLSDKPFMGSVTAGERALDTVEMVKILFGEEFIKENCVLASLINANSPLSFDKTMLDSLWVYAQHGQACIVSPFVVGGAMSPASVEAIIIQTYAEALVGIALTQLIRKGSPVIFGSFASSMSMQSGAPMFGMPESGLVQLVVAQLARRLGVPCRSGGGLCSSKIPDGQACYEAANSLNMTLLSGTNFVLHSAGWLEGGLVMGYEKFIMDCDQIRNLARTARGIDINEENLAMDAFLEVGPGGHFLGSAHTQRNFSTAFILPDLGDYNSFEQWQEEDSKDMATRASEKCQKMLASYEKPHLDAAVDAALQDFIKRRKQELGVTDSF